MKSFVLLSIVLISFSKNGFAQDTTTPSGVNVNNVCICVNTGLCGLAGGLGNTDGAGVLDPRIMSSGAPPSPITGANNETMVPASSGIQPVIQDRTTCPPMTEVCCPPFVGCGLVMPPVEGSPQPLEGQGQSEYGAYPWQVAILKPDNSFVASGVLIDHLHVLTVAHKVSSASLPLKARFGEWDAANDIEPYLDFESNIAVTFTHPKYNSANLQFDLVILRLATPAPIGVNPTITNICLPSTPIKPIKCWVSGWGKNDFSAGGAYQAVMKAVDVPLVDADNCVAKLRTTKLGKSFQLHSSFICAGGEPAKDACTGDGGAPLACKIGSRWFLAGLVAWGIGCGQTNVPGVYVNIQAHLAWIQQTTVLPSPLQSSGGATTTRAPSTAAPTVATGASSAAPSTTAPAATTSTIRASSAAPPTTAPAAATTAAPSTAAPTPTTLRATTAAPSTVKAAATTKQTVKATATTKPTVKAAATTTTKKPTPSSG